MGIVINQSIKNTLLTYLGFGVGAINTLFLYTNFLSESNFGLIALVLSTANIIMPLMAFGVYNTIVKFYSSYNTPDLQARFLGVMLWLPLVIIIPFGLVIYSFENELIHWLSKKNSDIKPYLYHIYWIGIMFAYFEVFYAWSKVHLKSVFGNFMKEVFHRLCISGLLLFYAYDFLTIGQFVNGVLLIYTLRVLVVGIRALQLKQPQFSMVGLSNIMAVIKYSSLIIIAGSVALIILEVDKFMLAQYIELSNVAYYSVAIFIATVIDVPQRAMQQITNPLTAQYLNKGEKNLLKELYKKTSITLLVVSGAIFMLILINIKSLYVLLPTNYSGGLLVVFYISLAKLTNSAIGNNNSILFYSNYYRVMLVFGVLIALCTVGLNLWLIPLIGINGAALASSLTIVIYNVLKLLFVYLKFGIQPFTFATLKILFVITFIVCLGCFWDLSNPYLSIGFKSLLCGLVYLLFIMKMKISEDVSNIINSLWIKKNPF